MGRRYIWAYILLVGVPLLTLAIILKSGQTLTALPAVATAQGARAAALVSPLNLSNLILQLGVILIASRLIGWPFQKLHQPQVVGEMLAGILLGPSLLGWLAPSLSHALFPASSLAYLNALSQVGLVLFMFLVGCSLDHEELRGLGHTAVLTSHVSIAVPFCLGSAVALYLYPRLSTSNVSFMSFSLFMGAAMSITAFPVLARILAERNLVKTRVGVLTIACAAVDDVTGWCILAYIVVLIRAEHAAGSAWTTLAGVLAYVTFMLFGVKRLLPWFEKHFRKHGRLTEGSISIMIALALGSALVTEQLGIHLVFGAFLMGAIMPKQRDFVDTLTHKMESVTVVVLLPLFFAFSGLRTNVATVTGGLWLYTALVIFVAVAGKFGGSAVAARMAGLPWREANTIGVLMNTRGLMELVALNIGLDIGVISPAVFTIMVLMALFTTAITSPLLSLIYPDLHLVADNKRLVA